LRTCRRIVALLIMLVALLAQPLYLRAQDGGQNKPPPTGATIHIVQRGETLFRIAVRYGVTVDVIIAANGIQDPTLIQAGQRLIIPNPSQNAPGVPLEYVVAPGDTIFRVAARFGANIASIAQRNRISNPALLFAGQRLVIREGSASGDEGLRTGWIHTVGRGETLYSIAVRYTLSTDQLMKANGLAAPHILYVGQKLIIPGPEDGPSLVDLPLPLVDFSMRPEQFEQGRTVQLRFSTAVPAQLQGTFLGRGLIILSDPNRLMHTALVGVDSMMAVNIYPMNLTITTDDGKQITFSYPMAIFDGGYASESLTLLPGQEDLLNPQLTEPESRQVFELVSKFTPTRYYGVQMGLPCPAPVTSQFGTRRSYNGGPFERVHAGTDFAGMPGSPIYASASGMVVWAGPMNVRGNATIIDHGQGVFSGYWHQQEINVQTGQLVQEGQMLGTIGQTGRVTGPHLHWEIFVHGIQVDPLQWTRQSFP
jgi:murein DD-endopeptidase MepM/ murein hydrolase activator NlpD